MTGDHRLCIWPVGKHTDKEIDIIPNSYLQWVMKQDWFHDKYPNLAGVVEKELEWRDYHNVEVE